MPLVFIKVEIMIQTNGEMTVTKAELHAEKLKLEKLYIDLSKRVKTLEDVKGVIMEKDEKDLFEEPKKVIKKTRGK